FANSTAANIGTAVVVNVNGAATLDLAGTVSALSTGAAPANRAAIQNNSSAAAGLLVSGSSQQVGDIDGAGTTQVKTGSDLTANHIVQGALVIGGTVSSPSLVTIAASDASGNPLAGTDGSALASSLTSDGTF